MGQVHSCLTISPTPTKLAWMMHLRMFTTMHVNIDVPCTDNQQFTLGRDGILYIEATGNKFIESTCAISLRAEDHKFQCSKLCFSVSKVELGTCDLKLSFYDSNVWNFGSAKPSLDATCRRRLSKRDWCTTGTTATVRLENLSGFRASTVGRYDLQMVAKSMCSDDTRKDPIRGAMMEEKETELASNQTLLIIVSSVLGCLVLCTCLIVLMLVWYIRRHSTFGNTSTRSRRHSDTMLSNIPDTDYHPVQVEDANHHDDNYLSEEEQQLMKENGVVLQNIDRVWREPTAPPTDEIPLQENRPPSYCTAPPEYTREDSNHSVTNINMPQDRSNVTDDNIIEEAHNVTNDITTEQDIGNHGKSDNKATSPQENSGNPSVTQSPERAGNSEQSSGSNIYPNIV
ncbi:hypothetical protein FSP39_014633 [Pinctada imbricata]|uniref:Uncharacterized protein n=1 Tax=Pinctada imbricata TaxID=66713 RepID=A0AA88XSZ0_PINIB|nr:hypothetical protein FSP39_014633 [Pinctada imbricata]